MKEYWKRYGLSSHEAEEAEKHLPEIKSLLGKMSEEQLEDAPEMLQIINTFHFGLAVCIVAEAKFQLYYLPERDKDFQKKYLAGDPVVL